MKKEKVWRFYKKQRDSTFPPTKIKQIFFHQGNQLLPACFIFGPSFKTFDDSIYEACRDEDITWTKLTAIKWSFLLDKLTSQPKCQTGSIKA